MLPSLLELLSELKLPPLLPKVDLGLKVEIMKELSDMVHQLLKELLLPLQKLDSELKVEIMKEL